MTTAKDLVLLSPSKMRHRKDKSPRDNLFNCRNIFSSRVTHGSGAAMVGCGARLKDFTFADTSMSKPRPSTVRENFCRKISSSRTSSGGEEKMKSRFSRVLESDKT